jgi:hypothetical protein
MTYDRPRPARRVRACISIRAVSEISAAAQMDILPSTLERILSGLHVGPPTRRVVDAWCDRVDRVFDRAIPDPREWWE